MTDASDKGDRRSDLFKDLLCDDMDEIDEEKNKRDEAAILKALERNAVVVNVEKDARFAVARAELAELQASFDSLAADLAEIDAARAQLPRTARTAGRTPTRRSLKRRPEKGRSSKK